MRRYEWKCETSGCPGIVEVLRPTAAYRVGPTKPCPKCGGTIFKKMVSKVHTIMHEDHTGQWPVRLPAFEKVHVRDTDGNPMYQDAGGRLIPVIEHKDVIFKNKQEQDDWLKAKGLVRTMDYRDPSVSDSQHSHFDGYDPSTPPSPEAGKLAEQIRFVEDPADFGFDVVDSTEPHTSASEASL